MAIHELATNSGKYGALSVPSGKLNVDWSIYNEDGTERLSLTWDESGGPAVEPPKRKGFGSMLFERVLTVQLDAKVQMDFRPTGLHIELALPLKRERLVPEYAPA
jgi:two-component sensor histidine kinase